MNYCLRAKIGLIADLPNRNTKNTALGLITAMLLLMSVNPGARKDIQSCQFACNANRSKKCVQQYGPTYKNLHVLYHNLLLCQISKV